MISLLSAGHGSPLSADYYYYHVLLFNNEITYFKVKLIQDVLKNISSTYRS